MLTENTLVFFLENYITIYNGTISFLSNIAFFNIVVFLYS